MKPSSSIYVVTSPKHEKRESENYISYLWNGSHTQVKIRVSYLNGNGSTGYIQITARRNNKGKIYKYKVIDREAKLVSGKLTE